LRLKAGKEIQAAARFSNSRERGSDVTCLLG
jgi:hypothetical protein